MKDRIAMQIIRGVEPLGWLEDRLRAQGYPGAVAGEQGLEFTDDLIGVAASGINGPEPFIL
ncbi:MAG: hypothetical protein WCO94_14310 [Verrucomicrobiota bacterium]